LDVEGREKSQSGSRKREVEKLAAGSRGGLAGEVGSIQADSAVASRKERLRLGNEASAESLGMWGRADFWLPPWEPFSLDSRMPTLYNILADSR